MRIIYLMLIPSTGCPAFKNFIGTNCGKLASSNIIIEIKTIVGMDKTINLLLQYVETDNAIVEHNPPNKKHKIIYDITYKYGKK